MNKNMSKIASALSALIFAGGAMAGSNTGILDVTATVVNVCTVTSSPLAFPTYNNTAPASANGLIVVNCLGGTPYSLFSDTPRQMTRSGGSETLDFNIYFDSSLLTSFPSTPGTLTAFGSGGDTNYVIYGVVPAGQSSVAGSYSTALTFTVSY